MAAATEGFSGDAEAYGSGAAASRSHSVTETTELLVDDPVERHVAPAGGAHDSARWRHETRSA